MSLEDLPPYMRKHYEHTRLVRWQRGWVSLGIVMLMIGLGTIVLNRPSLLTAITLCYGALSVFIGRWNS